MNYEEALVPLRDVLVRLESGPKNAGDQTVSEISVAKEKVRARYVPIFSIDNVKNINAEDFRSFLLFENNQHWSSLHRQGGLITSDMSRLREALELLVDENLPLDNRLNKLRPKSGEPMVKGLGRSVITAILQVVYPDKYGVLNNTAEAGMRKVDLWPKLAGSVSFAQRYAAVNNVLLELSSQLNIDLWTLDALWWRITIPETEPKKPGQDGGGGAIEPPTPETTIPDTTFGMESHLHDFLVDNWSKLEIGKEWNLLEEDGEITGSEYNTGEVGAIDLLAKRKTGNGWLVVELKRGQTSDETAGQILRYMSWVRLNLAREKEEVEGLVICRNIDKKMQYALDGQPHIRCMTYQVSFSLNPVSELRISKGENR